MRSKRLVYQIDRFLIGGVPVQNVESFSDVWQAPKGLGLPIIILEWSLIGGLTHRAIATDYRQTDGKIIYVVKGIEYVLEISEVKQEDGK